MGNMSKDYGSNLKWFLEEVSCVDDIESPFVDIYGETETGSDTSCSVDIRELCGSALAKIRELEMMGLNNG